jgi:hypothetical protein
MVVSTAGGLLLASNVLSSPMQIVGCMNACCQNCQIITRILEYSNTVQVLLARVIAS